RPGKNRKPVLAVNLLPPGSELGEQVLLIAVLLDLIARMSIAQVGNRFAVGLDDLEIVAVDPDPSLKVALLAFDLLRGDVKNIAVEFILLLLADIENVVFGQVLLGQ